MTSPLLSTMLLTILPPLFMISMNKHHLLMTLLLIESMILIIVLNISMLMLSNSKFQLHLIIITLTISACGASLGLAMLVKMMRSFGNDNMKNLSITKC